MKLLEDERKELFLMAQDYNLAVAKANSLKAQMAAVAAAYLHKYGYSVQYGYICIDCGILLAKAVNQCPNCLQIAQKQAYNQETSE